MNNEIKNDILAILNRTIEIFEEKKQKDTLEIRELSDHTTHNSSIYQDEDSINIAILILALSKLIENMQDNLDYERFNILLTKAKESLENDDIEYFRKYIKQIFNDIKSLDTGLKSYIKSQISKGTRLYEHGISAARSAEILGISEWELLNYAGKSDLLEPTYETRGIRKKLEYARRIFSK